MQKILLLALLITFLTIQPSTNEEAFQDQKTAQIEAKKVDLRAEILKDYLAQYNSPLQTHAQDFVDAANEYQVDWKLVPAIAGVESTFGKNIPGGYNGWGWGVYGSNVIYFNSWRHGIYTVTQGLREKYISRGLGTPYEMNRIYATSPRWGANVNYFLNDLEKYAQNYPQKPKLEQISNAAVSSAKLAYQPY